MEAKEKPNNSARGHWGPLRGALLGTLGGFGAGLILSRVLGLGPRYSLLLAGAGLLGGGTGALSFALEKTRAGLLLGLAAVLSFFGSGFLTHSFFAALASGAAAVLVYAGVYFGGYGFCGPLGCWSVILLVPAIFLSGSLGARWQALAVLGGILALLLTLDGFRDTSLRRGQHLGKGDHLGDPGGVQAGSLRMYLLFLLGSLLAAAFLMGLGSLLAQGLKELGWFLLYGTGRFGYFLAQLLRMFMRWLLFLLPEAPEDRDSFGPESDYEPPVYTGGSGSLLSTILLVLMIAAAVVAVGLFAGNAILQRRPRLRRDTSNTDYVDEIESLERPRRRLRDLFSRKPRARDYQGSMKVRFAFQELLRRRKRDDPTACSRTPNELRRDQAREDALIDAYNQVRYAGREATAEQVAAAEAYLRAK